MFDSTTKLSPNNVFRVASGDRVELVPPIGTTFIDNTTGYWYVGDDITSGGNSLLVEGTIINVSGVSGSTQNGTLGIHTPLEMMDEAVMWDDLKFPFTSTRRGSLSKPDFDYTNVGLSFPQNNPDEKIYAVGQFPHNRKAGTDVNFHIHWTQTTASYPTWKVDYLWYDNGDQIPAWTTVSGTSGIFPYVSGSMAQITDIADVVGTNIIGVSSIIKLIIYRDDNVVTGDVLGDEFDVHYKIDSLGSDQEYFKSF